MQTTPLALLVALSTLGNALAIDSPVQSGARPYDLDIAAPVQMAGSDAAAANFQATALPSFTAIFNDSLSAARASNPFSAVALDPSKLTLSSDSNVRVYFVGEGAGYRNTLGFATTGGGVTGSNAALIFPDASTWGNERYGWAPLSPGDFVDLGTLKAGSALDFFLIADGAMGGKEVYTTNQSDNRDGLAHAAVLAPDGSPFLLFGFEDMLGSGNSRFNDVVFAVEITKANGAGLAAPEPSLAFGGVFAALAFGLHRRRRA